MDMNYFTMEVVGRERLEALRAEADRRSRIATARPPSRILRRLHHVLVRIRGSVVAGARSLAPR